jgi:hypothetical protein
LTPIVPKYGGKLPGLFLVAVAIGRFTGGRKSPKVDGPIDADKRDC